MKITEIKGVTIYTWEELKKELSNEEYADFMDWLRGQTIIEEGVYTWDYNRWKEGGRLIWLND